MAIRTPAVEQRVMTYLEGFKKEYASFEDKTEGKARQQRMKEELRAYTEDESDVVRKKATEIWNIMASPMSENGYGMTFGSKKTYISNAEKVQITNAVVAGLDPLLGKITNTKSHRFLSAIEKGISKFGHAIQRKLGSGVKDLLLLSQNKSYEAKVRANDNNKLNEKMLEDPNNSGNFSIVKGVRTKNAEIFTYQADYSPPDTLDKDKKYIIRFNGNGEFALHSASEMNLEAQTHECVVISFDYPGVSKSTGKSKGAQDMVDAGLAQVKRLTDMGVNPENIILKGHSIGGGVATLTAAALHEQNQKVHLFNTRSFSKLSKAAKHLLGGGVLGSIAAFAVRKVGWEMDSLKAWNKIPDTHKDFYFGSQDQVIPPEICGLAGAIGKADDQTRQDSVGHNDPIYGPNSYGSNSITIWDQFIENRFSQSLSLNAQIQAQAQQLVKAFEAISKRTPSDPSSRLSLSLQFNPSEGRRTFGKDADKILTILKNIGQGKTNSTQLKRLNELCKEAQRSSNSGLVKNISEFVADVKQSLEGPKERVSQSKRL